jgi:hypothetical protein
MNMLKLTMQDEMTCDVNVADIAASTGDLQYLEMAKKYHIRKPLLDFHSCVGCVFGGVGKIGTCGDHQYEQHSNLHAG